MRTDLKALHEQLKRDWCDAFAIAMLADGSLTVTTPFLFGDGDSYPVVVERDRGGWRLSDRGITVSQLQLAELTLTEGRRQQILQFAQSHACLFDDDVLSMMRETPPTAEDIADFLELIAQVSGLPLHSVIERESEQFRTRARERVMTWLVDPRVAERNWTPPRPRGDLFQADLHVRTRERPVVAFFAGSRQKADSSVISVGQYRRWGLDLKPLLAHNGSLTSETIYRAQIAFDDDSAVVRVNEREPDTGYLPLRRTLAEFGVEVR